MLHCIKCSFEGELLLQTACLSTIAAHFTDAHHLIVFKYVQLSWLHNPHRECFIPQTIQLLS